MRTTFEDREKKNKAPDPAGNTSGTAGSWEEYIRRAEEAERELFGDEAESAAEPGDPEETERDKYLSIEHEFVIEGTNGLEESLFLIF